jgi:hypothetical protein
MKRYRLVLIDFDSRASHLVREIKEEWDEKVKEIHRENKVKITKRLIEFYGEEYSESKIQNFIDLGDKPMSVIAFHNKFFEQIRVAFVMGAYYPALTATCARGERILNHLILTLREDYKETIQYKRIYRKDQFDDWDLLIHTLSAWDILLPDVTTNFKKLKNIRHRAIHFRPETDHNDRELALSAMNTLRDIISRQFSGWGNTPWSFVVPGEIYIKKNWENKPFIKYIYLSNCALVGPYHTILSIVPEWVFSDKYPYENKDVP